MKKQTMKQLPKGLQPYERCKESGPGVLNDAELLAVILRSGSKNMNAVELGRQILSLADGSLSGLAKISLPEYMNLPGIGEVKGIQLQCLAELTKRIAKGKARNSLNFSDPKTIADFFMEELRQECQEVLKLLLLNTRNDLILEKNITKGTVNSSMIAVREIFVEALRYQAVSIILLHNHPSGDPCPSSEDIRSTNRVAAAGKMIGIDLLDHIVIGEQKYVSFKERGLL